MMGKKKKKLASKKWSRADKLMLLSIIVDLIGILLTSLKK